MYKEQYLIECFINKINHYQRVFSRFDKLANRYLGYLSFIDALCQQNLVSSSLGLSRMIHLLTLGRPMRAKVSPEALCKLKGVDRLINALCVPRFDTLSPSRYNQSRGYDENISRDQTNPANSKALPGPKVWGGAEIGVFGSYVRNEQRPDSDVDILIELERPPRISLIGLVELEDYLSNLLGVKVDVALRKNLKKRIGQRILSEVVPV